MPFDFSTYEFMLFNIFKYFKLYNYARFSQTCVLFREISKNKDFKKVLIIYYILVIMIYQPKHITKLQNNFLTLL